MCWLYSSEVVTGGLKLSKTMQSLIAIPKMGSIRPNRKAPRVIEGDIKADCNDLGYCTSARPRNTLIFRH